jgi:hypothetical protein
MFIYVYYICVQDGGRKEGGKEERQAVRKDKKKGRQEGQVDRTDKAEGR